MGIRNHEHYVDTTPYFAMKEMRDNPKPGDVFAYKEKTVLIVGTGKKIATILTLIQGSSEENKTRVHESWYTNINQISYAYHNNLDEYQFKISKEEMESVKLEIVETFDLYDVIESEENTVVTTIEPAKPVRISQFDVINDWKLDFYTGAAIMNLYLASKHNDATMIVDLEKAISILETKLKYMKGE